MTYVPPVQTPGPTGDTGIGAAPTNQLTSTQQNAWTQLQQTLQSYGFTAPQVNQLMDFSKTQIINGNSSDQIILNLETTPEFAQRFPAIIARQKAGLPPISPSDYLSLETSYEQAERAAGIPVNFASYDNLIAHDVSPTEYSDRINQGYLQVANLPPNVMRAFQGYYGVTQGQLAAYFLDPTKAEPMLINQAKAAQIGAAAWEAGWGDTTWKGQPALSQYAAMNLAQHGVTMTQAEQGFQTLAGEKQLTETLPGQGQRYGFTPAALLNEQFGADGQTKLQLEIQADQEKNAFQGGANVGSTSTGLTGAGTVQR